MDSSVASKKPITEIPTFEHPFPLPFLAQFNSEGCDHDIVSGWIKSIEEINSLIGLHNQALEKDEQHLVCS